MLGLYWRQIEWKQLTDKVEAAGVAAGTKQLLAYIWTKEVHCRKATYREDDQVDEPDNDLKH